MELATLGPLVIALGLGLLVGLEREWAGSPIAGIRTFPLITLLGALAARLAARFGGWLVPAALFAVAVILGVAAWARWAPPARTQAPRSESPPRRRRSSLTLWMAAIAASSFRRVDRRPLPPSFSPG